MAGIKLFQIIPMLDLLFSFWMQFITGKPSFKGHKLKHLINLWSESRRIIKPLMRAKENGSRAKVGHRKQREGKGREDVLSKSLVKNSEPLSHPSAHDFTWVWWQLIYKGWKTSLHWYLRIFQGVKHSKCWQLKLTLNSPTAIEEE